MNFDSVNQFITLDFIGKWKKNASLSWGVFVVFLYSD